MLSVKGLCAREEDEYSNSIENDSDENSDDDEDEVEPELDEAPLKHKGSK